MNPPNPGIEEVTGNQQYPGLDIHDAMARTGNKPDLLGCLLKIFVEQHSADIGRINKALQLGERGTAISIVHSLAGTAGNLSALSVHRIARDFETILRDAAVPLPHEVPSEFSAGFHVAIDSMKRFVTDLNSPGTEQCAKRIETIKRS